MITGKYHTSVKLKQKLQRTNLLFCFNKISGHSAETGADVGTAETGVNLSQQQDYHAT